MVMKLYVESVSPLSSKLKCSQSVRMSCPMFSSRRTATNRSRSVLTQKRYTRFLSLALIRFPLYFNMFINTPFWIWKKRSIVKTNRLSKQITLLFSCWIKNNTFYFFWFKESCFKYHAIWKCLVFTI